MPFLDGRLPLIRPRVGERGSSRVLVLALPSHFPTARDAATDHALERAILDLLEQRAPGATICPSEAARAVGDDRWRPLMEPARAAALRLVGRGAVEITQRGEVVDGSSARGPIRIRRIAHR